MKLKFGFVKVRYRGLKKNAHRLFVTCALVNSLPISLVFYRADNPSKGVIGSIRFHNEKPPS
jgi:hypothetical protein